MSNTTTANHRKIKSVLNREWFARELLILAVVLLLMVCGVQALWINLQSELRAIDRAIRAGATRQEVEEKLGKPRWISKPGQPLSDVDWNGQEKSTISKYGLSVYWGSMFAFVICEFDEQDKLRKATFSPK